MRIIISTQTALEALDAASVRIDTRAHVVLDQNDTSPAARAADHFGDSPVCSVAKTTRLALPRPSGVSPPIGRKA